MTVIAESHRATAALAALGALAAAWAALVSFHLLDPQVEAVARFCRLPIASGAGPSLSGGRSAAVPAPNLLAAAFLLSGVGLAVVRLVRTLRRTRRVAARLGAASAAAPPPVAARVSARAAGLGLPVSPVVAELGNRPAAFTLGLLRPRMVVSTAVALALTDTELDALLLHEAAHARRRDPLRLLVAGVCRDLLFFLPIAHTLFRLAGQAQERAADDAAAAATNPLDVAGALIAFLKLTRSRPAVALAPGAAGADAEARIRRLLDAPPADCSRWASRSRAGASVLVSALLLVALAGMPARALDAVLAGCCAAMAAAAGPGLAC